MFADPQQLVAILAGAALIFGGAGAAIRNATHKPETTAPVMPDAPHADEDDA
jgi:hypothetical protein